MATKFSIVPSALWVKRGVAKAKPTKVKLPAEELRNLIDNSGLNETSDDEEEKMEAEAPEGASLPSS
ncbi:hypothetical protein L596_016985 [Steinernema carpocapsae]|uniref:Uncharacterized protein n=1 Tax=Steinernema carpocapsae TaxID=34508 RepID=A0A4U5N0I8_STECR|nr:hypothetical protein L596_016985 [Steinernema carpocapsae]